jgi:hypothetical protein
MCAPTVCIVMSGARVLTAIVRSNVSSGMSRIGPLVITPAQLTRTSTRPDALDRLGRRAAGRVGIGEVHGDRVDPRRPAVRVRMRSSSVGKTSSATTARLRAGTPSTIARPMPRAPPVTTTVLAVESLTQTLRIEERLACDAEVARRGRAGSRPWRRPLARGVTVERDVRRRVERRGEEVVDRSDDRAVRRDAHETVGAVQGDPQVSLGIEREPVGVGAGSSTNVSIGPPSRPRGSSIRATRSACASTTRERVPSASRRRRSDSPGRRSVQVVIAPLRIDAHDLGRPSSPEQVR